MTFDSREHLTGLLQVALASIAPEHTETPIHLERPKQTSHGDFATNLPMQLARALKLAPRVIAERLVAALPESPQVSAVSIAGAGFINFSLQADTKTRVVQTVLAQAGDFGRSALGQQARVLVEFVSANPTGPLHVGHGRGAAYGASLSDLLAFAGWQVTREYYVNDAGRQMDILAISTWLRYLDQHGVAVDYPPNAYQGDYVRDMARQLTSAHGDKYVRSRVAVLDSTPGLPDTASTDEAAKTQREVHLDALIANGKKLLGEDWAYVHRHALSEQLADGRDDLDGFGVDFQNWFSENSLFDTGLVARCLERLDAAGHVYEKNGARWFRSTDFGDEKDRVVQRDNGLYTYFASDIAYHLNKYERGFDRMINIWGADHHGYIPRVKGAVQALALDPAKLDIALVQFAVLYRHGEKASMSTRAGDYVTLRALRAEVGDDACRFFYVLRKADQHLDFDLDLAKSQSADNPVYYIQYAHARICSLMSQWQGVAADLQTADLALLTNAKENALTAMLDRFPEVIESAARDLAPHQVAFYLRDLAAEFHGYYNAERMLVDDAQLTCARLALSVAVRQVIRNGMTLLGVSCPETM